MSTSSDFKCRPAGATRHRQVTLTGSYEGGWKASGTTGKAIGSFYYVQQYMREQSKTVVD